MHNLRAGFLFCHLLSPPALRQQDTSSPKPAEHQLALPPFPNPQREERTIESRRPPDCTVFYHSRPPCVPPSPLVSPKGSSHATRHTNPPTLPTRVLLALLSLDLTSGGSFHASGHQSPSTSSNRLLIPTSSTGSCTFASNSICVSL